MNVYNNILSVDAIGEGYKNMFSIENPEHKQLSRVSPYISKCFAILHVKFGYDRAVTVFNKSILRITDVFDLSFCELDEVINNQTLSLVTVLSIKGYEEVLLREMVKYVIRDTKSGGLHLKERYRF